MPIICANVLAKILRSANGIHRPIKAATRFVRAKSVTRCRQLYTCVGKCWGWAAVGTMRHQIQIVICNAILCSNWIVCVGDLPPALGTDPANTHTRSRCLGATLTVHTRSQRLGTTAQSQRLHLCSQSISHKLTVEHIHSVSARFQVDISTIVSTICQMME